MRSWPAVWVYLLACAACIGGGIYAITQGDSRLCVALWVIAPLCLMGALISTPVNRR